VQLVDKAGVQTLRDDVGAARDADVLVAGGGAPTFSASARAEK
jgi:hypothetical protein